jgi:hypothetical protein
MLSAKKQITDLRAISEVVHDFSEYKHRPVLIDSLKENRINRGCSGHGNVKPDFFRMAYGSYTLNMAEVRKKTE